MWRFLPSSPEVLSRLEWWLWIVAAGVAILSVLMGVVAREAGRYKASLLQGRLDDALRQRDEKALALETKTHELVVRQAEQEKNAPRRLTATQRSELIALLREKPPDAARVMVAPLPGDSETLHFARDLLEALLEAGWTAHLYASALFNDWYGVTVVVNFDAPKQHIGSPLLLEALQRVGVQAGAVHEKHFPAIRLSVGQKPS